MCGIFFYYWEGDIFFVGDGGDGFREGIKNFRG